MIDWRIFLGFWFYCIRRKGYDNRDTYLYLLCDRLVHEIRWVHIHWMNWVGGIPWLVFCSYFSKYQCNCYMIDLSSSDLKICSSYLNQIIQTVHHSQKSQKRLFSFSQNFYPTQTFQVKAHISSAFEAPFYKIILYLNDSNIMLLLM